MSRHKRSVNSNTSGRLNRAQPFCAPGYRRRAYRLDNLPGTCQKRVHLGERNGVVASAMASTSDHASCSRAFPATHRLDKIAEREAHLPYWPAAGRVS